MIAAFTFLMGTPINSKKEAKKEEGKTKDRKQNIMGHFMTVIDRDCSYTYGSMGNILLKDQQG